MTSDTSSRVRHDAVLRTLSRSVYSTRGKRKNNCKSSLFIFILACFYYISAWGENTPVTVRSQSSPRSHVENMTYIQIRGFTSSCRKSGARPLHFHNWKTFDPHRNVTNAEQHHKYWRRFHHLCFKVNSSNLLCYVSNSQFIHGVCWFIVRPPFPSSNFRLENGHFGYSAPTRRNKTYKVLQTSSVAQVDSNSDETRQAACTQRQSFYIRKTISAIIGKK